MKKHLKFRCWVKTADGSTVTYHSSDLISFTRFLDKQYPKWRFFNVYHNGLVVASFTQSHRPTKKIPF